MNFKFTFLFLLAGISFTQVQAQYQGKHDITFTYAESKEVTGEITQIKEAPKITGSVPGVVGSNFSAAELNRLPTRNINKISGLSLGVQSEGGQEPIFKGAVGGTAYFVDGIRVRSGTIGVSGYSY